MLNVSSRARLNLRQWSPSVWCLCVRSAADLRVSVNSLRQNGAVAADGDLQSKTQALANQVTPCRALLTCRSRPQNYIIGQNTNEFIGAVIKLSVTDVTLHQTLHDELAGCVSV